MDDNACLRPEATVVVRVCNSSSVKERPQDWRSRLGTLMAAFTWHCWQPVVALTSPSLYLGQNSSVPSRPIYTQHPGWSTGPGRTRGREGSFPLQPRIQIQFLLMLFSWNPKCRLCGLAEEAAWNVKLFVNVNQTISIVWYYRYHSGAENCIKRSCESTSETSQKFRAKKFVVWERHRGSILVQALWVWNRLPQVTFIQPSIHISVPLFCLPACLPMTWLL